MNDRDILQAFKETVCREIEIEKKGLNRYIVYTPFAFDDGDHYVVILEREDNHWLLTDEGHTFMHLSYGGVDVLAGQRGELVKNSLAAYGLENRSGELVLNVPEEQFGDALFSYLQAINRVQSTALWTRSRGSSTFRDDFKALLRESVPPEKLEFDYADRTDDPGSIYKVDSRVIGRGGDWFIFAVANNDQCRNATITCYHFEKRRRSFNGAVIYENQEELASRSLAQISDVVGKQFSSLGQRDRIKQFLKVDVLGG